MQTGTNGSLLDNYEGAERAFISMGEDWVKDFLLPILDEMWGEIQKTQFTKYPQTSEKFKKLIKEASYNQNRSAIFLENYIKEN